MAGAGFGAVTALVNAFSFRSQDVESRAATVSGWSPVEIVSVLLDAGWAWAGLAVFMGWLVTRAEKSPFGVGALVLGATAGALALFAATAAYGVVEAAQEGGPVSSWYPSENAIWWITSFVFGGPLGAVGACATRSGLIGLLGKTTVPVGAAVQMLVLPPGRNEVITTIGQVIVWAAAATAVGWAVVRFLAAGRRRARPGSAA